MNTAVYRVPRSPRMLVVFRLFRLSKEHSGYKIVDVRRRMMLVRCLSNAGAPALVASAEKESPMIMEYARLAKKHLNVVAATGTQADEGLMDLVQASLIVLASCTSHTRPISAKQYAEATPRVKAIAIAGVRPIAVSEKAATPAGSDSTPAPIMLFA
jgi:hypothetical protein